MCFNHDDNNIEYKEYKTIDEQIKYLRESKKIIVDEKDWHWFENINYISIINPYKEFFATNQIIVNNNGVPKKIHLYANKTDFKQFIILSNLDNEISAYLYEIIGIFEKKYKNILFQEICSLYTASCPKDKKEDKTCTIYADEIQTFLDDENSYPRFCTNIKNQLTKKGIRENLDLVEPRKDLLKKMLNIGTVLKSDKKNTLIEHYKKTQGIAPLWTLTNALSLGEFNILYSMLDVSTQKKILARLKNIDIFKLNERDISSFLGYLENVRRIRNIINHYEPIIPFFIDNITEKKIENSQMIATIRIILSIYKDCPNHQKKEFDFPDILETDYNRRKIKLMKFMLNEIKVNDK